MSRNTRIACVETSIGSGGNADRMLRAFADLYRGGRCAFASQWNRPRLELNLRKEAEMYWIDDGCYEFGKHQTLLGER